MIENKPCPFCGGKGGELHGAAFFALYEAWIECSNCSAKTRKVHGDVLAEIVKEAWRLWNNRTDKS